MPAPGFGDRVRIRDSEEMREHGFAGRVGDIYGETVPSTSGAGPVIGDRGEDLAFSVFFEDTREQEWFAPHEVEFVDHGGAQTMSIDGGPSFTRAADGVWHEAGGSTEVGRLLSPARRRPRVATVSLGAVRRWLSGRR